MRQVLSGAGWLSDCPGSQSIASGLNPSLDVSEAMLFCCSLYYGKKHKNGSIGCRTHRGETRKEPVLL